MNNGSVIVSLRDFILHIRTFSYLYLSETSPRVARDIQPMLVVSGHQCTQRGTSPGRTSIQPTIRRSAAQPERQVLQHGIISILEHMRYGRNISLVYVKLLAAGSCDSMGVTYQGFLPFMRWFTICNYSYNCSNTLSCWVWYPAANAR